MSFREDLGTTFTNVTGLEKMPVDPDAPQHAFQIPFGVLSAGCGKTMGKAMRRLDREPYGGENVSLMTMAHARLYFTKIYDIIVNLDPDKEKPRLMCPFHNNIGESLAGAILDIYTILWALIESAVPEKNPTVADLPTTEVIRSWLPLVTELCTLIASYPVETLNKTLTNSPPDELKVDDTALLLRTYRPFDCSAEEPVFRPEVQTQIIQEFKTRFREEVRKASHKGVWIEDHLQNRICPGVEYMRPLVKASMDIFLADWEQMQSTVKDQEVGVIFEHFRSNIANGKSRFFKIETVRKKLPNYLEGQV